MAFFAVGQAPKGKVNPDRVKHQDPKVLTKHIKRVAHYMGADIVGIAATHASLLYSDGAEVDNLGSVPGLAQKNEAEQGVPVPERYPYAIVVTVAWDYDKIQAHRHHIGDHAYHFSQAKLGAIYENLVRYIKEMGYSAVRNLAQPMPTALSAGLGEMGRNGILITEKYGARIHLSSPILTDMPLVADKPIDIGVSDFCQRCRKCATTCPDEQHHHGRQGGAQRDQEVQAELGDVLPAAGVRDGLLGSVHVVRDDLPLHEAAAVVA